MKKAFGKWWGGVTLRQIWEIDAIVQMIERERPGWFQKPVKDSSGDSEEMDQSGKVALAINVYRLRREYAQMARQLIWIVLAFGGLIAAAFKLFAG